MDGERHVPSSASASAPSHPSDVCDVWCGSVNGVKSEIWATTERGPCRAGCLPVSPSVPGMPVEWRCGVPRRGAGFAALLCMDVHRGVLVHVY
eukprot:362011-Chlamydomonas_euryale.AAC.7